MVQKSTALDWIVERCRLALPLKYRKSTLLQAEPLLEKEIELIRKLGFEDTLVQAVEFGNHLRREKVNFHLVGSGGSSEVFFLLGMSEVDPIHYRTHFQRLWKTSSGETPVLQFVVEPESRSQWIQIPRPSCVSVHPMTSLEAIPAMLEKQLSGVSMNMRDMQTFLSLQTGDTEGIFQMEFSEIRTLLSQIQPTRIKDIAIVTALNLISVSHRGVVDEFLQMSAGNSARKRNTERTKVPERQDHLPFVYQEAIMNILRSAAGLPWEETYRFVSAAAKARMNDQHDLWNPVIEGLKLRSGEGRESLLPKVVAASSWAVCKAHHAANAITTYKAAFFRTHHRELFEQVRSQIISTEQGA